MEEVVDDNKGANKNKKIPPLIRMKAREIKKKKKKKKKKEKKRKKKKKKEKQKRGCPWLCGPPPAPPGGGGFPLFVFREAGGVGGGPVLREERRERGERGPGPPS